MSSACDVLRDEPRRFLDYLLSNQKIREKIVDKKSFTEALERAFKSDPTLDNILDTIKKQGESLEICGENIFDLPDVQNLIKRNINQRRNILKQRVKTENPTLKRREINKETERRLKIYISQTSNRIRQTKQVTIQDSTQPVRVGSYTRGSQVIGAYRKTKYKSLTTQERMLIENGVKKGKTPQQIADDYLQSGLGFRTKTSIKRHFYRIKEQMKSP